MNAGGRNASVAALMNSFDLTLFHLVNQLAGHHPLLDGCMIAFTQYSPAMFAALFVIAWFLLPRGDIDRRRALIVSVAGGLLALLINLAITYLWFRSRPFAVLPPGQVNQLIAHAADASFPSDHVSGSFGFAAALWRREPKGLGLLFTAIGIVVAFARVYVGVHWPTDVISGAAVGIVAGEAAWLAAPVFRPLTRIGMRLTKLDAGQP